jgi:galactitol-specific phosphotransferase system IIC component
VATLTFDKLAYVDRLQAAGMGEREARALAEGLDQALREEVATRTDIAAVRTGLAADIAAVKTELAANIAAVKTELAADIAAVRTELAADIALVKSELSADIASVKHDMLRWTVGMAFAQVGLTVALIRFLPH